MTMNTKVYLRQVYDAHRKIKMLTVKREAIRAELYSVRSPAGAMTPDRVQTSLTGDRMERLVAKVDRLDRDILDELEELFTLQKKITKQIEAIQPERQREVLLRRYCYFQKWESIASDMEVSLRYVYKLHGKALLTFARKYNTVKQL